MCDLDLDGKREINCRFMQHRITFEKEFQLEQHSDQSNHHQPGLFYITLSVVNAAFLLTACPSRCDSTESSRDSCLLVTMDSFTSY